MATPNSLYWNANPLTPPEYTGHTSVAVDYISACHSAPPKLGTSTRERELSQPETNDLYQTPHYSHTSYTCFMAYNTDQHHSSQTTTRNPIYLPTYSEVWAEKLSTAMESLGIDPQTQDHIQVGQEQRGTAPMDRFRSEHTNPHPWYQCYQHLPRSPYGNTTHRSRASKSRAGTSRRANSGSHGHPVMSSELYDVAFDLSSDYSGTPRPDVNILIRGTPEEKMQQLLNVGSQFDYVVDYLGLIVTRRDVDQDMAM